MNGKLVNVTTWNFSGDGVTVTFSRENPDEPVLVYQDGQGEHKFSGRSIFQENTQLGLIVTVALDKAPDLHSAFLSLAVPSANRPENARSIPVSSFAVVTSKKTSFAGPQFVEGQLQTYKLFSLDGNAW